jgi:hypothetical protein
VIGDEPENTIKDRRRPRLLCRGAKASYHRTETACGWFTPRVPHGETSRRAGCRRSARPVVCPAKAGMFSRRQTCRGNSQEPRSLDSRVAGNQDSEAYRQGLPWGDHESPGRNESERASGLENEWIRGPSLQLKGEGSMGCRNLTDAASRSRRGGSDSTVARTCRATGEALLVPGRNHRSKVDRITGTTGKTIEGERVADGSVVAMKRSNVRGAKGPRCL